MMSKIFRITVCMTNVLLSACATQAPVTDLAPVTRIDSPPQQPAQVRSAAPQLPMHDVQSRLLAHHATWRGTPHEWGGLTRKGVDCSGYIWHTYRDLFEQSLPRTTRGQVQLGQRVSRSQLREGDLVFFKIGPGRRHAGIYVGNGRFAHASYSKGVTISALNNTYWKRRYWQSRRLL
ncbi:MAG: cell wall-associated NlpC family hydrolase [Gammaproteobacteria bacterium]|jgi:cell wall-associated NlpC family hydrolase